MFSRFMTAPMSVRVLLNGLIAISLLPALVLLGIFAWRAGEAERQVIEARRTDIVSNLSYLVEGDISVVKAMVTSLASSPELINGDFAAFRQHALASVGDRVAVLAVLEPGGQQVMSTFVPPGEPLPKRDDMSPFAEVLNGKIIVSDILQGTAVKRPVISVASPVTRDGRVAYILSAVVYPERLVGYFAQAGVNPNWAAAVVDRRGKFVLRNLNLEQLMGKSARPEVVAAAGGVADSGEFDNRTIEGVPTGNSFRRSSVTGWTAVVSVPADVLAAPIRLALTWLGASAVGVGLFSWVLARSLAARLSHSIGAFGSAATALLDGKPLPETPAHVAELAEVRRAYEHTQAIAVARREADERVKFLMGELSHRSKNLLAVVQAVANQTGRSAASLDDFQKRFSMRLEGLRVSHDLLVHRSWSAAPISELISQQLAPFADRSGGQLHVTCANISLDARATEAVGLALHELATNAAKYGALSVQGGKVTISGSISEKEPNRPFLLTWTESGGPAVGEPKRRGFGHFVIGQMVSQSVGGSAEASYNPEGFRWKLLISCAHYSDATTMVEPEASLGKVRAFAR